MKCHKAHCILGQSNHYASTVACDSDPDRVWIFHGARRADFASGVFATSEGGLAWAATHRVSGILAEYPVGDGSYDAAVREGRFRPSKPHHGSPEHIAGFSPGLQHIHLTDGRPD